MSAKKISDILTFLETKAPAGTAESWDNVGLLVGEPSTETTQAVVCVDLTLEALEAALQSGAKLIVNHHPCLFPRAGGLPRLQPGGRPDALATLIFRAIQKGVSVIACHTNFDQCALEVPTGIAHALGVKIQGRLIERAKGTDDSTFIKLVTYVPESDLERVKTSIFGAGAGQVGHYDQCSFKVEGTGSFRGDPGTQPAVGVAGRLESVLEYRLETILPRGLQKRVLKALFKAHPYEEPAYDLYPVIQAADPRNAGGFGLGYGFYGSFETPIGFADFTQQLKKTFSVPGFYVSEPTPAQVKRIGFVAGKGAGFITAARAAGCDVFVTGEAGYHAQLEGARSGITVIELGHRESERFFLSVMSEWLTGLGLQVQTLHTRLQTFQS